MPGEGEALMIDEYLRRNLIHCKAVGVSAGLAECIRHLQTVKHPPKWLVTILNCEWRKMGDIANELAAHRNEEKP